MVSGYADGGDAPDKQLDLVPGALDDARAFLDKKAGTRARFNMVSDLVDGFKSSFGLELLTTVHWIVNEEKTFVFDEIVSHVYAWDKRNRQFSKRQIGIGCHVLCENGCIDHVDMPESL